MECQGRGQAGGPVFQAINHPVGHVTEALLHWWYRRSPRDDQGLPEEIQSFFTNLCDTFTQRELADATRALPQKGLWHTAHALSRAIEGAGEQRSEYWRNRVLPYFESIWPKSEASISPLISKSLVLLCVSASEAFPEALKRLKHWLQPLENPNVVICELNKTDLNKRFPDDTLQFLDHIIDEKSSLHSDWLLSCLKAIRSANPSFEADPRFQRLKYRCQGS